MLTKRPAAAIAALTHLPSSPQVSSSLTTPHICQPSAHLHQDIAAPRPPQDYSIIMSENTRENIPQEIEVPSQKTPMSPVSKSSSKISDCPHDNHKAAAPAAAGDDEANTTERFENNNSNNKRMTIAEAEHNFARIKNESRGPRWVRSRSYQEVEAQAEAARVARMDDPVFMERLQKQQKEGLEQAKKDLFKLGEMDDALKGFEEQRRQGLLNDALRDIEKQRRKNSFGQESLC